LQKKKRKHRKVAQGQIKVGEVPVISRMKRSNQREARMMLKLRNQKVFSLRLNIKTVKIVLIATKKRSNRLIDYTLIFNNNHNKKCKVNNYFAFF
jgi:hypothetical protein